MRLMPSFRRWHGGMFGYSSMRGAITLRPQTQPQRVLIEGSAGRETLQLVARVGGQLSFGSEVAKIGNRKMM